MKEQILSLFNKRKPINEFDYIKNEFKRVMGHHIKLEQISVVKQGTFCAGKFGEYNVYFNNIDTVWLDELNKVKGFTIYYIQKLDYGFKICISSDRTIDEVQQFSEGVKLG